MKKRLTAAVLVLLVVGLVAYGCGQQTAATSDASKTSAPGSSATVGNTAPDNADQPDPKGKTGQTNDKSDSKDDKTSGKKDVKPEQTAPDDPTPQATKDGIKYVIPYERGNGSVEFSRQNDMLRVDFDVRLPYSAGNGQASRGSSIDLMLSVDGLHGRHLMFFPNPLWMPDGRGTMCAFRLEASYDKDSKRPGRLDSEPTFVGKSDVKHWASWKATMWIDLRLVLIPGNSPASASDNWYAGMVIGNQAATVVFPAGMNMFNPALTPDKMVSFQYSKLPQRAELDDSPRDTLTETEKNMHDSMRTIEAKLRVQDIPGTWQEVQKACKNWPDSLWALNLQWKLSNSADVRKIKGIDEAYLPYEKQYVEAGPGQSSAHLEYLYNLLLKGHDSTAITHAHTVFESPMCTGRAQTGGNMRMQWAQRCIMWGETAEAEKQLDYVKQHPDLLKDDNFRVEYKFQQAALAVRLGDSSKAVELYSAMLKDERKFLNSKQFTQIQHDLQFQRQAVEQWKDELKYQKEDAGKTNPRLVIETAKGKIVVELFEDDAPNTTAALVKLAKDKFYDGLNFHRVEPNFVAQGGDPNGDGSGSPGWRLKAEISRRNHFRGTFAMARSMDPDSQGCQFYICVSNSEPVLSLSGKYVVAGRVIEGMKIADMLRVGDKIISIRAENLRDHEYEPKTLPE